ncbi:MAG: FAD-dependent oxidoreductase [Rhodospirillaceae bacterium]|nr:FAD-dependent oxidoreductase [Rhodospirillaceae bacterium]MBT5456528.1 FAD-dependent oxidoreductase [Rhodospirillaceae bacterium]
MGDYDNRNVAVVGSGPGGIYVAQALLEKAPGCRIDIIDKLPTPFGLVRGGVAPDHQHTKRVDRKYAETLGHESVRLVGNLALGRDISLDELIGLYDSVVLAYGAPWDNKLGVPGEDKKGVYGSNAFVGWYNCHPDFRDLDPNLDIAGAAVIGIGNVAIDVARVLSRTPQEMITTDIADYAMEPIDSSPIKDIYMFGRRGPIEAAFTNTELKEMGALEAATTVVDATAIPTELPDGMDDREQKVRTRILDTLRGLSDSKEGEKRRTVHIEFFAMPVEILGGDSVEGIRMERTKVEDGRCVGTGETFDIPCGMVVTCIGSRAEPIEGVPFNDRWGIAENDEGRVKQGVYAVGWLKRGASGTIGTNRLDSYAVADLILEDFSGDAKAGPDGLDGFIKDHDLRVTNYQDWLTIKALEEGAAPDPTPRQKYSTVEDMLTALDSA